MGSNRLDILKALGDNTRYAIYLELARAPRPLSTSDVADVLDLHPNTVRPHLERMRDVGLLRVDTEARGGVGRPQHLYSLTPEAPALGLEPSPFPTLARMLLGAAADAGLDASDMVTAGRAQGAADAARWASPSAHSPDVTAAAAVDAVEVEQARLGFDPATVTHATGATIAFAHCPFRDLAEQHPELVCSLHCAMVEGFTDEFGGVEVVAFHNLAARTPCQVELGSSRRHQPASPGVPASV